MSRSLPTNWQSTREGILQRDRYSCLLCSHDGGDTSLEVHHIIPRLKGGTHNPRNLATVCRTCHLKIHSSHDTTECQHESTFAQILESVESYQWQAANVSLPSTPERVGRLVGGIVPTPTRITTNLSVRKAVPDVVPRHFTDFMGDVFTHRTTTNSEC